jgi:transcription antitermination protein NusB
MNEGNAQFNQYLHERILILLYQKEFRTENIEYLNQLMDEDIDPDVDIVLAEAPIQITNKIIELTKEIDDSIQEFLENWSFDRIMLIDKESIRIGVYELLYERELEPKIVIDRLVRLSKKYGGENSSKFVNGILGAVYRKYINDKE